MRRKLYLGLMSGTSLDGVDGVLAQFSDSGAGRPHTLAAAHRAFAPELRAELLALNRSGADEIHRSALAANALARLYAEVVHAVLDAAGVRPEQVSAIGAHGQTLRHRPREFDGTGYTVQILNGALLAELAGIDVVCDLRSRDLAAGGQGAPLVPAFHAACFGSTGEELALLNLGGIANLTLLPASGAVRGFDCGPGNLLMDAWCQAHVGTAFDDDGRWAAGGRVHVELLERCLAEPYFVRLPPKSTGRDLFGAAWLAARLPAPAPSAQDVMATLAELTARAATDALQRHAPATRRLLVCGGGARNGHLMRRLQSLLAEAAVQSTAELGIAPEHVEALAFAWLAQAHVERRAGNVPAVTGAAGPRVLGATYPAR